MLSICTYVRIVCNYTYSRLYSIYQINKTYLHHSTNSAQNVLVKEPELVQTVTKYKDMATAMASLIVDTKVWSFWLKTMHMHLPLCILIQTHYYYIYYLHKLCKYTHTHSYTKQHTSQPVFPMQILAFSQTTLTHFTLVCTIFSGLFCVWFKCGDTKFIADSIWSNWLTIDCKLSIHMLFIYIVCRCLVASGTSIFGFHLMPFTNAAIFTNSSLFFTNILLSYIFIMVFQLLCMLFYLVAQTQYNYVIINI